MEQNRLIWVNQLDCVQILGSCGSAYEDTVFWDVILCSLVDSYQLLEEPAASIFRVGE
jgi:hypothetical protein